MDRMTEMLAGTALALALAVPAAPAFAADATGDDGEITVIAQRRAEKLTDVPMSITALSSEDLSKAGVANIGDLAKVSPAVTIPFYGAFMQPSIRGVSSTGANIGDNANVAMYVDGVYQPQQIATMMDLPDVQQVEILKGPQGALYGQNATGGAILVTSQKPSFTTTGRFSIGYGNYNAFRMTAFLSGPISQTVAASIAGGAESRDGFRRHVITGQRDFGLDSKVVRGKLLFQPSDGTSITLTGFYSKRNDSSPYAGQALNGNSVGYFFVPTAPKTSNPDLFTTNPGVGVHTESYGGNLKAEFDLGAGTLTSITAYTHNLTTYLADADYSPVNYAEAATQHLSGEYFTQDVNFASEQTGIFSYLLGAMYLKGNETFNFSDFQIYIPSVPPAAQGSPVFALNQYGKVEKEIWAAYGEVTIRPVERLTITAGGRYTTEKQRGFSNPLGPIIEYPRGRQTFNKFTPRVTVRYEVMPDANLYASWGQGFKSGIINTANFAQAPVNPERITAWEAGFKGRMGNVSLELAGFYYDYKDLQVVAYNPPEYIQQNAASARIKGVEASGEWRVTPEFTLAGGMAYLDAHYRSFPAAQIFVPTGFGNLQQTADLGGRQLLRAPKFTANASADYRVDLTQGTLGAHVAFYYNSGSGFEVSNRIRQQKYATLDAELSFAPKGLDGLRIVAWGKNLTDKAYYASFLASQLADGVSFAPPRTYGLRLDYAF